MSTTPAGTTARDHLRHDHGGAHGAVRAASADRAPRHRLGACQPRVRPSPRARGRLGSGAPARPRAPGDGHPRRAVVAPARCSSADWVREHRATSTSCTSTSASTPQSPRASRTSWRRSAGEAKPLVFTVHDLRNPHHLDRGPTTRHLDVLVPAADELITLTPGAAAEISASVGPRGGRPAAPPRRRVSPHRRRPRPRRRERVRVGVHAKSLRASMDPAAASPSIADVVRDLPGARLQVNVHHDVADARRRRGTTRADAVAAGRGRPGLVELPVHDFFSDEDLWAVPRVGWTCRCCPTASARTRGWLEACLDLGTAVLAPTCGYFARAASRA